MAEDKDKPPTGTPPRLAMYGHVTKLVVCTQREQWVYLLPETRQKQHGPKA